MRVMVKTVADFTGLVHFRHAYELGGVYRTGNMFLALATSFVFLWVFYDGDNKEAVWTLMLGGQRELVSDICGVLAAHEAAVQVHVLLLEDG